MIGCKFYKILSVYLLLLIQQICAGHEDTILLEPPQSRIPVDSTKALLHLAHPLFPLSCYVPLSLKVQQLSMYNKTHSRQSARLFVGIGRTSDCQRIQEMIDQLVTLNGDRRFSQVIVAAHGQEAAEVIQSCVNSQQVTVDGLLLMGSTLDRQYRWTNNGTFDQGVRRLVIGGLNDGVCRPMRIVEELYHSVLNQREISGYYEDGLPVVSEVKYGNRVVLLLPSLSHQSFAPSGSVYPSKLQQYLDRYDLKSQLSQEESIYLLAPYINRYVNTRVPVIQEFFEEQLQSIRLMSPMLTTMLLEGNKYLQPPCGDINDVDPASVRRRYPCFMGSAWSEFIHIVQVAQHHNTSAMLLSRNITFLSFDEFHKSYIHFPTHMPQLSSQCRFRGSRNEDCIMMLQSISQNLYDGERSFKLQLGWRKDQLQSRSFYPSNTASEIKVKMKSRQSAHFTLGNKTASFMELDYEDNRRCSDLNQHSMQLVQYLLTNNQSGLLPQSESVLTNIINRLWQDEVGLPYQGLGAQQFRDYWMQYVENGIQIRFAEDIGPFVNGARWIWTPLQQKLIVEKSADQSSHLLVRSPSLKFAHEFLIKSAGGVHYCKLLSPARVMEWVLTDSLRVYV
ncbi:hypothetical protein MIR68_002022 [Amoeboaphelidium protococcarum]|nr:hypothetical protein MIR68_002022 [Amoeboaphelidium protococcarum]